MADTLTTTTTVSTIPSGTVIATDDAGASGHVQLVKLALSADGSATPITADANGMEVQGAGVAGTPAGGVVSVQGVASGTVLPVGDNSGSLTVDAPVGTPVFVRLSDGSAAITTLAVSAASLPLPSGAATAAKQPALGTAGASSADVISVQGIASGTALPVSAASLPLPSGAATAANQSTANGLLTTIDADTSTLAGAVSGTEMQVDIVGALPAGTNAIGKLAANSGVDIGDVDVASITGAASLAVNQVSVGATATQIVAARTGRRSLGVVMHGATAIYVGPTNGVTTSNGTLVPGVVGASLGLDYAGALYGITASGSVTVGYTEEY